MSLNPLAPITDYPSMLNRIFWFTTASALVATWVLRTCLPGLDGLLHEIDFIVELGNDKVIPVPGGYLVPALAVGILSRVYRIHARLSDWLGVRETFDVDVIMTELASRLGIDVERDELLANRKRMMRSCFYAFVSGPQPKIDSLLVYQALDAWSWLWIGIESALVLTLAGMVLVAGGVYQTGLLVVGGTILAAAIGLPAVRHQCQRYAVAQVRAILADPARELEVRKVFAELVEGRTSVRLAA